MKLLYCAILLTCIVYSKQQGPNPCARCLGSSTYERKSKICWCQALTYDPHDVSTCNNWCTKRSEPLTRRGCNFGVDISNMAACHYYYKLPKSGSGEDPTVYPYE